MRAVRLALPFLTVVLASATLYCIPQTMVGRRARMAGVTKVTTHSKAAADHLIAEGAQLHRNADGTATEVQFVASGVELHKR